jgi:LacI family transcriptional regulator
LAKITSKEIAKEAGVSVSTVSIVLNNKPGVGAKTRERVLKILANHGISLKHSNLAPSRGVVNFCKIVKHGQIINDRHNVFISEYIDGVVEEATAREMAVEVSTYQGLPLTEVIADLSQKTGLTGCVLLATEFDEKDLALFGSLQVPYVFLDAVFPYASGAFVTMDNSGMVHAALAHLKEQGHRRVGMFAADCGSNFEARERAFRESVRLLGLQTEERFIVRVQSTLATSTKDVKDFLKQQQKEDLPTAFLACNDIVAIGAIRALQDGDIQVPGDVSVIGFDDLPMSSLLHPPLTTLTVPKLSIGRLAVRVLLNGWQKGEKITTQKNYLGGTLISRESVLTRS